MDDSERTETYVFPSRAVMKLDSPAFSEFGDPVDDLSVATVLMMVGGKLVLLRPRKVGFLFRISFLQYLNVPIVSRPRSQV